MQKSKSSTLLHYCIQGPVSKYTNETNPSNDFQCGLMKKLTTYAGKIFIEIRLWPLLSKLSKYVFSGAIVEHQWDKASESSRGKLWDPEHIQISEKYRKSKNIELQPWKLITERKNLPNSLQNNKQYTSWYEWVKTN